MRAPEPSLSEFEGEPDAPPAEAEGLSASLESEAAPNAAEAPPEELPEAPPAAAEPEAEAEASEPEEPGEPEAAPALSASPPARLLGGGEALAVAAGTEGVAGVAPTAPSSAPVPAVLAGRSSSPPSADASGLEAPRPAPPEASPSLESPPERRGDADDSPELPPLLPPPSPRPSDLHEETSVSYMLPILAHSRQPLNLAASWGQLKRSIPESAMRVTHLADSLETRVVHVGARGREGLDVLALALALLWERGEAVELGRGADGW